jgi:hypothetical protein
MKTKEEVKNYMQHALKKSSQHERRTILRRVDLYVSHLEYVHQMDIVSRIAYWECAYAVFEYLYRHKQVRRNVGKFDAEVKKTLDDVIRELWHGDDEL